MKKLLLIVSALVGFQLSAQVKAIEGLELTKTEENVYDFKIPEGNDEQAYVVLCGLVEECKTFSDIELSILSKNALYGLYFRFEEYDVVYIMYKGGRVAGALIEKKKGA